MSIRRCATGAAILTLLLALPLHGQQRARVNASLETGAAAIEQPLIRGGSAFYIAPAASLTARDASIGGNAVLAAGSPTWQSFLGTIVAQAPAVRGVRVSAAAQALKTSGLLHTLHGDLGLDWRTTLGATATSTRISTGQLSHAGAWWRDVSAGAAVARTHGAFTLALDASFTAARRPAALQLQIGSLPTSVDPVRTEVLDFTPRMIWERSRLRADASIALRVAERRVDGARFGPQVAFTIQTARGISLFAGGAQRLPDIRSGIPSGRSAVVGIRLEGRRLLSSPSKPAVMFPALRLERTTLLVDAGDAPIARVELRGDFTDWLPRTCQPRGRRYFDCGEAPATGTWRVSLRLDGGAWQHPTNLSTVADDLGSLDGVLQIGPKPD